jgi:putative ABC transport system permease protein
VVTGGFSSNGILRNDGEDGIERLLGISFALGAERGDVLRLVIRQGILLTGVGLALGLIVAFAVTRLLGSLLYGIRATDPLIWCGVSLVLGLVALLAMWLPASRASRVDPTEALRYE